MVDLNIIRKLVYKSTNNLPLKEVSILIENNSFRMTAIIRILQIKIEIKFMT